MLSLAPLSKWTLSAGGPNAAHQRTRWNQTLDNGQDRLAHFNLRHNNADGGGGEVCVSARQSYNARWSDLSSLMRNGNPVPILVNSGKAAILTGRAISILLRLEHKIKVWDQSHISSPELLIKISQLEVSFMRRIFAFWQFNNLLKWKIRVGA